MLCRWWENKNRHQFDARDADDALAQSVQDWRVIRGLVNQVQQLVHESRPLLPRVQPRVRLRTCDRFVQCSCKGACMMWHYFLLTCQGICAHAAVMSKRAVRAGTIDSTAQWGTLCHVSALTSAP